MRKLISGLCTISVLAYSHSVLADSLKFSYWDDAKPPFVIKQDALVSSGIIKDFAELIVSEIGVKAEFVKLPVPRIEQSLQSGAIDMDCLTSPIWKELPGEYNWSPKLFDGSDRFLVQSELKSKIESFSDLKGLSLGIYNGYVYHPELMELISSAELNAVKVKGLEHGIQLLKLKRLDALMP